MKIGGKTKVGITLSLGVLVGLGLVILPGLFATPTTNSTGANIRTPTPAYTVVPNSSVSKSSQPVLDPTTVGNLAFTIALILLPAISLSIFARYWTLKDSKNKLKSENE